MEVQTFTTDTDYRISDADYYKTYTDEQKHTYLIELFKSLEESQGNAFVITKGEQYIGEYAFPYRKIDFSDIYEFKRILEKVSYFIKPEDYNRLLDLIEKAKENKIEYFSYQFKFEVDPRELRSHSGDFLKTENFVTDFIFYYGKPKFPEVEFTFKQKEDNI